MSGEGDGMVGLVLVKHTAGAEREREREVGAVPMRSSNNYTLQLRSR